MHLTKRSTILGLPVGPRRADPLEVAALGLGLTAVAGSLAVASITRRLVRVADTARTTLDKVGQAADQATTVGERVAEPLEVVNSVVDLVADGA